MAARKSSKFRARDVLPIWTSSNTTLNNLMFAQFMQRLGVTDFGSYFRKLWPLIVLTVFICAAIGATYGTLKALLVGVVSGLAAPAAVVSLAITVVHALMYLAIYLLAWGAILLCVWWLLHH